MRALELQVFFFQIRLLKGLREIPQNAEHVPLLHVGQLRLNNAQHLVEADQGSENRLCINYMSVLLVHLSGSDPVLLLYRYYLVVV